MHAFIMEVLDPVLKSNQSFSEDQRVIREVVLLGTSFKVRTEADELAFKETISEAQRNLSKFSGVLNPLQRALLALMNMCEDNLRLRQEMLELKAVVSSTIHESRRQLARVKRSLLALQETEETTSRGAPQDPPGNSPEEMVSGGNHGDEVFSK